MLKRRYVLIAALLCVVRNFTCFAQTAFSRYEFRWACFHPVAAFQVKKHLPRAIAVYDAQRRCGEPDAFNSGGKLDAFRHAYTMAYLSRYVKPRKLRRLGLAHEQGNRRQFRKGLKEEGERPDSLACEMDLRNNELGFSIGLVNQQAPDSLLRMVVLEAMARGEAWYLKRNASGQYTDCEGKVIELELYREHWYVPKCLVRTSE